MKNLEEVKEEVSFKYNCLGWDDLMGDVYSKAYEDPEKYYDEVANRYASQFQPKWIKIESEEDLPKEHGEYIVRLKSGKVKGAAYYAESKRFYTGGNVNDNPVTHWMPLPDPPKED